VAQCFGVQFSIITHANTSLLVVYGCTIESDSSGGELQEGEWRSLAAIPHKSLNWRYEKSVDLGSAQFLTPPPICDPR
jgi:hypothetical protein